MQDKFLFAGAYLAAVNVVTFALFAWDKYCATHDKWRVRESTLLFWSAIGGAIGAGAAMNICHHKTLHLKFKFGVPFLLFIQIILFGILLFNPGNILEKIFH
ncbi:MAG: DUF1294 domain-containing protein [Selenomonadaceae bacterium]|nr:DUF1294 domain-containing protein [Selenomonadaceae bacterium]